MSEGEKTRTTIKISRDLWQEIRRRAYREKTSISEVLEKILEDRLRLKDDQ